MTTITDLCRPNRWKVVENSRDETAHFPDRTKDAKFKIVDESNGTCTLRFVSGFPKDWVDQKCELKKQVDSHPHLPSYDHITPEPDYLELVKSSPGPGMMPIITLTRSAYGEKKDKPVVTFGYPRSDEHFESLTHGGAHGIEN